MKHEHRSHLGDLHNRRNFFAVPFDRNDMRLVGQVVIEQVVPHDLPMPLHPPIRAVNGDHGIGIGNIGDAPRAIEIDRRAAGGDEDSVRLRIDAERRPYVGAAGLVGQLGRNGD